MNKELVIAGVEGTLEEIFDIVKFVSFIHIFAKVEMAEAYFHLGPSIRVMERSHIKQLLEYAVEAISITDPDRMDTVGETLLYQITGYDNSEVIGNSLSFLKSGLHDKAFYDQMWGSIEYL